MEELFKRGMELSQAMIGLCSIVQNENIQYTNQDIEYFDEQAKHLIKKLGIWKTDVKMFCEDGIEEKYKGVVFLTVWNTPELRSYQSHAVLEVKDVIKAEHIVKAADWVAKTFGEGDHKCIVEISIHNKELSGFSALDHAFIR